MDSICQISLTILTDVMKSSKTGGRTRFHISPSCHCFLQFCQQTSSPEEAEVQQQSLTGAESADDREAKSTTATSKKSSKKKPSAKKDKTSTKKAGKDKQKTKKQT